MNGKKVLMLIFGVLTLVCWILWMILALILAQGGPFVKAVGFVGVVSMVAAMIMMLILRKGEQGTPDEAEKTLKGSNRDEKDE